MLLAQISPPVEIAAWLACAAFVIMLLNGGFKLRNNLLGSGNKISPQPLQVQMADAFPSKAEFHEQMVENKKVHDQLFANMSGKERGLRDEFSKELRGLRDDLGKTSNTMHELKGEMKQLSIQLVSMQQELQNT